MVDVQINIHCPLCDYGEPYRYLLEACPSCGSTLLDATYQIGGPLRWPDILHTRPNSMWRYRELLPLRDDANIVTMREGGTPLLRSEHLGAMLGLNNLFVKDERQGPTGSFKDRQASLAISVMRENDIKEMVVASTGNVAIAYAAYAVRAGIQLWAFITSSVPSEKMREISLYGAELVKVTGTYDQTKQVAGSFAKARGLFLDKGIRSIAAKESMKTLAFEIAEQLAEALGPPPGSRIPWRVPDWYIQSVSGGLGPAGVMKGFRELNSHHLAMGMPKLGNIQAAGCAPMVKGFEQGLEEAPPVLNPQTVIATVATGTPGAAYQILRRDVLNYGGAFEAVTDEEAFRALKLLARLDGLSMEPAAAIAFAGLFKLVRAGKIQPDEVVVVNCSGHTFPVEKYILGDEVGRTIDVTPGARQEVPQEGLLAALQSIDRRVSSVAVIEDSPDAARLIERILTAHGVKQVLHALDGASGLELIRQRRPDLIVLDLMMPNVDGFEVLNALKADEDLHDLPVVVVTAKDLTRQERERLAGQVQMLLQKGSMIDEDFLQELVEGLS
jgi:threonine synthase